MGSLKPGATYVYEHVNGTTYAREFGSLDRFVVGHTYQRDPLDHRNYMSDPNESQLWHDIRRAASDNEELLEAINRVKILYYLSRKDG